jgi:hypothetical protein
LPKRVIDGEGLWRSKKLAKVEPEEYRAEYANLIPLALANGSFECDPRMIWSRVYAYNRPKITPVIVDSMLSEFERVKLLFRWKDQDGTDWGYWVGIEKSGRLPAASRCKHETFGATVPGDELAKFIGHTNGQPMASHDVANGAVGLGLGLGLGSCGADGFDGEKAVHEIIRAYSKPDYSPLTCTYVLEAIEEEAKQQDISKRDAAAYILRHTRRVAKTIDNPKFAKNAQDFFLGRQYRPPETEQPTNGKRGYEATAEELGATPEELKKRYGVKMQ